MRIRLRVINRAETELVTSELTRCCGSGRWVEGMVQKRPFNTPEELFAEADKLWSRLSVEDWREAFAHHPKIGDIESLRAKYADTADLCAGEQKGVQGAGEEVLKELARLNDEYERKFGYIFIVCATGKGASEMLDILRTRIGNEPGREINIAAEEQRKITRIRLEKMLA